MMEPSPTPMPRVRHIESELLSSEADCDEGKRFKPGSPLAARAAAAAADDTAAAAVGGTAASAASSNGTSA